MSGVTLFKFLNVFFQNDLTQEIVSSDVFGVQTTNHYNNLPWTIWNNELVELLQFEVEFGFNDHDVSNVNITALYNGFDMIVKDSSNSTLRLLTTGLSLQTI